MTVTASGDYGVATDAGDRGNHFHRGRFRIGKRFGPGVPGDPVRSVE